MTEAERVKWKVVVDHLAAAFEVVAELDENTSGQQQFTACVMASELLRLGLAAQSLINRNDELEQSP
jgi:hypothetical protein